MKPNKRVKEEEEEEWRKRGKEARKEGRRAPGSRPMNRLLPFSLYFFRRRSDKQQQGKVREIEKKMKAIYGAGPRRRDGEEAGPNDARKQGRFVKIQRKESGRKTTGEGKRRTKAEVGGAPSFLLRRGELLHPSDLVEQL